MRDACCTYPPCVRILRTRPFKVALRDVVDLECWGCRKLKRRNTGVPARVCMYGSICARFAAAVPAVCCCCWTTAPCVLRAANAFETPEGTVWVPWIKYATCVTRSWELGISGLSLFIYLFIEARA